MSQGDTYVLSDVDIVPFGSSDTRFLPVPSLFDPRCPMSPMPPSSYTDSSLFHSSGTLSRDGCLCLCPEQTSS